MGNKYKDYNKGCIYAILILIAIFVIIILICGWHEKDPDAVAIFALIVCGLMVLWNIIARARYDEKLISSNYSHLEKQNKELLDCVKQQNELYSDAKTLGDSNIAHISELLSDYLTLQYETSAFLLAAKQRPAYMEAQRISELRAKTKVIIQQNKILLYKYEYLLKIFPELEEYVDSFDTLKELINFNDVKQVVEEHDAVKDYISKTEYQQLSESERNQRALDNYIKKRDKSLWFIGRDYELYCGYLLRNDGYTVKQNGIEKKLEDLGRDIIAEKVNSRGEREILIIQCKLWSSQKVIHEKYIAQLFGTKVMYELEHPELPKSAKVIGVFMTNIKYSNEAQLFADKLGIELRTQQMDDNFPRIKCNINNGNKIYHLPFDQQYDTAQICNPGEFYALTVKEAEKAGFRRAYRWHGE